MSFIPTRYLGNYVSFIKAIHPKSFMEFLDLDLDILEQVNYQTKNEKNEISKEESTLFELIIKTGSLDFTKYATQFLIDAYGTEFNSLIYYSLLQRDNDFTKSVLEHLSSKYSTTDMMCENAKEHYYASFLPDFFVKNTGQDDLNIFLDYDKSFLSYKSPREWLETIQLISHYTREEHQIFPLYHFMQAYVSEIHEHDKRVEFSQQTVEFLLDNHYQLEPCVSAAILCALSHAKKEDMEKLWEQIAIKNDSSTALFESDLAENMLDYLISVFSAHSNTRGIEKLLGYQTESADFLFNPGFAQLLMEKNVFKDNIGSLESLMYAHFDYIASQETQFKTELLQNVTFSEGVLNYIAHAPLELKLALFKGLSACENLHHNINEYLYDNMFKKCLVDDEYFTQFRHESDQQRYLKKIEESQNKYINFLNEMAQQPNGFKEFVETHIDSNTLSVENQALFLKVFIKNNNIKVAKLKI